MWVSTENSHFDVSHPRPSKNFTLSPFTNFTHETAIRINVAHIHFFGVHTNLLYTEDTISRTSDISLYLWANRRPPMWNSEDPFSLSSFFFNWVFFINTVHFRKTVVLWYIQYIYITLSHNIICAIYAFICCMKLLRQNSFSFIYSLRKDIFRKKREKQSIKYNLTSLIYFFISHILVNCNNPKRIRACFVSFQP